MSASKGDQREKRVEEMWTPPQSSSGVRDSGPGNNLGQIYGKEEKTTAKEVIEIFSKIRQKGSVAECQEHFEELKSQVMMSLPHLPESYYISIFTSGLKEEIKPMVKIIKPTTIAKAFEVALLQGEVMEEVMEISIQALSGDTRTKTIRIPSFIKRMKISILIDSGSTHSFVDEQLVQSLNCKMESIKPVAVKVAGGEKLINNAICNPLI
ncbi:Uncharacterized protein Adt_05551 [Abeliophyllum distichum]|uniref:Uncharacterized protein n=1 Tax=Abeliophyllum distichum TaxID=126358 RepID=A0ABD1V4E2_9LAMI